MRSAAFVLFCLVSSVCTQARTICDLSDKEIAVLIGSRNPKDLLALWTVPGTTSNDRLRICYFPARLLDFSNELNEWLPGQLNYGLNSSFELRFRKAFANVSTEDENAIKRTLTEIVTDPSRGMNSRIAAALTATAFDGNEMQECLELLAICLFGEVRSSAKSEIGPNIALVNRILQSLDSSAVLANLLSLAQTLQSKDASDEDIERAFFLLRKGEFHAPFLVEAGDRERSRIIVTNANYYNNPESNGQGIEIAVSTTEFAILEEYRSNELDSFPRNLRFNVFSSLFAELKILLRSSASFRDSYLSNIADDVELIASRMLKCDSSYEAMSSLACLGDCDRCAEIDPSISPLEIPPEILQSQCFKVVQPEYALGRRTTDLLANFRLAASLGKNWESSILSNK